MEQTPDPKLPTEHAHAKQPAPKPKKSGGNTLLRCVVMLILLAGVMALAVAADVFNGFEEIVAMLNVSKDTIFKLLIMLIFVAFISQVLGAILQSFKTRAGRVGTFSAVLYSLVQYATVLLGFCWALSILGVNVSTIFASLGIVALIIGFGAESLIADLVTGLFMLFENQYNVGDIIEVDGFRGTVQDIGIRTTAIVDVGGNVKIMNNSAMKNIVNRSDWQSVAVSDIGVAYGVDLEALEQRLPDMLSAIREKHTDVFTGDITYLGVEQLADSAVVLRFVAPVTEKDVFSGRRILNRELKVAFNKTGVEIPFPQVDVHSR